jgi:hypothetical protein
MLLWMATGSVFAQPADPMPRYLRGANSFGCETDAESFRVAQAEQRDPCLRIGPLHVGMSRADAEGVLGNPATSVPFGTRQAYAYTLATDGSGIAPTYAVMTYDEKDRADSVQITGLAFPRNWSFSGIALGTSEAALETRLGKPFETRESEDPGAMHWGYLPWTFSFEVKAGIVSSIRLADH